VAAADLQHRRTEEDRRGKRREHEVVTVGAGLELARRGAGVGADEWARAQPWHIERGDRSVDRSWRCSEHDRDAMGATGSRVR
jgi:hypothetical protein